MAELATALRLGALTAVLALGACSETFVETPCSTRCGQGASCPSTMTCGADDYCHAEGDSTDCSVDAAPPPMGTSDARRAPPDSGRPMPPDATAATPDAFVPSPDAPCGYLWPHQDLEANESVASCNGDFFLIMQGDDNLVLYRETASGNDVPLWASDTVDSGAVRVIMQGDGNLVLYRACGPCSGADAVWASNTEGNPDAYLTVRDDGTLILVSPSGTPLWQAP